MISDLITVYTALSVTADITDLQMLFYNYCILLAPSSTTVVLGGNQPPERKRLDHTVGNDFALAK